MLKKYWLITYQSFGIGMSPSDPRTVESRKSPQKFLADLYPSHLGGL